MIRYAWVLVFSLTFFLTAFAQERMGPIPAEKMTAAQKKAAADHTAARGSLTGPWSVLLRSPELMGRVRGLSDYVRFNSVLAPRLSEFVILITARQWSQAYEWSAHYPLAVKGGLNPDIAKAIGDGRRPHGMAEDEEALYDFCTELLQNRSVSEATLIGADGVVGSAETFAGLVLGLRPIGLPLRATPSAPTAHPPLLCEGNGRFVLKKSRSCV